MTEDDHKNLTSNWKIRRWLIKILTTSIKHNKYHVFDNHITNFGILESTALIFDKIHVNYYDAANFSTLRSDYTNFYPIPTILHFSCYNSSAKGSEPLIKMTVFEQILS
jgi:hypothetical protein